MYLIKNSSESQAGHEIINSFHNTWMFLFKNTDKPFVIYKMGLDYSPEYLLDVNEAFCNKLNYSRAELLSKNPRELFGNIIDEARRMDSHGAIQNENVIKRQYLIDKEGRKVPFEIYGYFSMSEGRPFGLAVALDISDNACFSQDVKMAKKFDEKNITLKKSLKRAIDAKEFLLYYQPKVDAITGGISGAEALIRWNHKGSIVPPISFIPIAEETGLIIPIGQWVLANACCQAMEWAKKGFPSMKVSVNISAVQLQHRDFLYTTKQILRDTRINPDQIELEITESALIDNFHHSNEILNTLREIGVNISLDDFGTGYSSLNYLRNLNIDNLKIDRAFIKDIVKDKKNLAIVKSIIEMAHSLGIAVTAEGIEDIAQFNVLRQFKCDYTQGYLFSPPLPADEFEKFLARESNMSDAYSSDVK